MTTKTTSILVLLMIAVAVIAGALLWNQLPEQMASHWNINDEVDGYISKFWGVFLMPLVVLGMFGLFIALPNMDPLKANIESFRSAFNLFILLITVFMLYIHGLTLAWSLGNQSFKMSTMMLPFMGILFTPELDGQESGFEFWGQLIDFVAGVHDGPAPSRPQLALGWGTAEENRHNNALMAARLTWEGEPAARHTRGGTTTHRYAARSRVWCVPPSDPGPVHTLADTVDAHLTFRPDRPWRLRYELEHLCHRRRCPHRHGPLAGLAQGLLGDRPRRRGHQGRPGEGRHHR